MTSRRPSERRQTSHHPSSCDGHVTCPNRRIETCRQRNEENTKMLLAKWWGVLFILPVPRRRTRERRRTYGRGGALPATEARPRRPECDEIDPARASPGPGLRAGSSAAQRDQAPPLRPGRGRQSGQAGAARAPRRGLAARPRGLQLDRAAALRSSPGSRTQGVPAPAAGRRTCHLSAPWSARGTGTVERTTWHGTQLTYRPETPAWFTSDRSPCRTV